MFEFWADGTASYSPTGFLSSYSEDLFRLIYFGTISIVVGRFIYWATGKLARERSGGRVSFRSFPIEEDEHLLTVERDRGEIAACRSGDAWRMRSSPATLRHRILDDRNRGAHGSGCESTAAKASLTAGDRAW